MDRTSLGAASGLMLSGEQHIGTIKVFEYMETAADQEIDFEILKQPKFWAYSASANAWPHSSDGEVHTQNSLTNSLDYQSNDNDSTNSLNSSHSS